VSEDAAALARDRFAQMDGFRVKRMFGGPGLFAGDVMFGLIDDGLIFLKTDGELEADLRAAGSYAWINLATQPF
jgi:DNA transformation protein